MALSGSFGKDFGAYWRLQGDWSATQNESANTSTVTLKTYLIADSAIYGSSTNSGSSTIEGTVDSFSTTPGTSAGSKRLLQTQTKTITHNSDGTFPDLDLAIEYDVNVTLSGTYYGNISASTSVALNTIPRESTLTSGQSWTAGSDATVAIKRNSTSFKHEVEMYVYPGDRNSTADHVHQVLFSTSETSKSTGFDAASKREQFVLLNGRSSAPTYVILQTYKGDDWIGSNYYDNGTITAPLATTVDTGHDDWDNDVYYDQSIYIPLARKDSEFTHTVRIKLGTFTKTFTGVGTSVTWTPTAAEQASIAAQIGKTAISRAGTIEVDTWYDGDVRVRTMPTPTAITFRLRNVAPTFNGTTVTYLDYNTGTGASPDTVAITGNNQIIISGKSKVKVTLPVASRALPQGGADMVQYVATLAGKPVTMNYSATADVVFDFGVIEATTNQAVVIRAVDSRGQGTTLSKTITVLPYNTPGFSASAARVNGFEASTILKASGTAQSIKVGGVEKNAVLSVKYRTKAAASATFGSYVTMPHTGFPGFTATDQTIQLTNTEAYTIEFLVTDKLGSTTLQRSVPTGKPLLFLDDFLNAIGVGDFPSKPNTMMMAMTLEFAGNKYASQGGGIQLNNSDILGANSIFFGDWTNTDGEGIHFPHSTWTGTAGTIPSTTERDTFRIVDGVPLINGYPMDMKWNNRIIWSGTAYPNPEPFNIPFSPDGTKELTDFPHGVILVWSEYVVGGSSQATGYQFTVVPKEIIPITGGWIKVILYNTNNAVVHKRLYFNPTNIAAHADCSSSTVNGGINRTMVLVNVIGF